jgi:hypothetical protein
VLADTRNQARPVQFEQHVGRPAGAEPDGEHLGGPPGAHVGLRPDGGPDLLEPRERVSGGAGRPAKNVASGILTPPGSLSAEHRDALATITARCPELDTIRTLARQFADMLTHR